MTELFFRMYMYVFVLSALTPAECQIDPFVANVLIV